MAWPAGRQVRPTVWDGCLFDGLLAGQTVTRGRVSYRLGLLTRDEGRGLCERRFLTLINTNDGNDRNVTLKNLFVLLFLTLAETRAPAKNLRCAPDPYFRYCVIQG